MLKNTKKVLLYLLIFTFVIRFLFAFAYIDFNSEVFYYEYGNINKNIIAGKGYSLFYIENGSIKYEFNPKAQPTPSAYMPPGYSLLTLPIFLIQNVYLRNIVIMLFQSLLAVLAALFLYKLTAYLFNEQIGIIAVCLYAFLPEFIYATTSFGPTLVYHIFIALIFYQLARYQKSKEKKYILRVFLLSSILILFRMEFFLFSFILIIYFIKLKEFKLSIIGIILISFALMPWQARNYLTFGTFIPFTTSNGLNLYRGHNLENPGIWADDSVDAKLKELKMSKNFEVELNQMYTKQASNAIIKNGLSGELNLAVRKLFNLWIYYPGDSKSKNLFYLTPWIVLLALSMLGIFKTFEINKFAMFYLFFLYHSTLAIVYFSLPRYQTMMKIALIPFAAFYIYYIIKNISTFKIKTKM